MQFDQLKRREFITLLGGAAATWPPAARAQQLATRIPRLGFIDYADFWEPFRQGLRDLGYIEGQNIAIEYRTTEARLERLAEAATELAGLPVDVIVTYGTPASRAAKQATRTIPIVMLGIGDPLRTGLVASLAKPGGNVTGTTMLGPDIAGKRLQLLLEAVPKVSRAAVLMNPDNASNVAILVELRIAATTLGIKLLPVEVRDPNALDSTLAAMLQERPDALLITADALHQLHARTIIEFVAKNRLPAIYQLKDNVVAGGLMSYGSSLPDLFRRSASHVHRILQGAKPGDLPVEQPTKFELVINLKTAKALGLDLPPTLLARADDVIE